MGAQMRKIRKFCGVPIQQKEKCVDCPNQENCKKENNAITAKGILSDCEGFYYVFKKLEVFNAYPIFDGDMEKHEKEWDEYTKIHQKVPFLTPTEVVNGAFAVELALKFLVFKEKGEYKYGHNLHILFRQLPDPHKSILLERIYKDAHQNADTLEVNLSSIANLFDDYRYFYEHKSVGHTNFLNDFIHIVCEYAISQKSEFEAEDVGNYD